MADIVLATLNARYQHAAFGLRYLFANLGDLQSRAVLREFTIQQASLDIVEAIARDRPRIVGFGVYIWNVEETARVLTSLRRILPDVWIVLGGPEVSYEYDIQPICQLVDYIITGEADQAFATLCRRLLTDPPSAEPTADGGSGPQVIHAAVPMLAELTLPYDLYSDADVAQRVVYVEASRGCPFTCEFCLSALEIPVRQFMLSPFLKSMQRLLDRGCRSFKFVDRTFNLNLRVSREILQFFLDRYEPGLFLHFEMIPDRLPESLRELIARFPPGVLQFEVGIQSWNDDVSDLISRRQDNALAEANLRWLRAHTGVHLHTDLIIGLPGEDVASFAAGFDRLVALSPQEIQVGILKRLRGTPIIRHDDAWQMVYSDHPPYEILQNRHIDFATMQELRRFAKTWDLIANSGNFVSTLPWFWCDGSSPFAAVLGFSRWLWEEAGRTHGIALPRLLTYVFTYLTEIRRQNPAELAEVLYEDYRRGGRSDVPECLRPWRSGGAEVAPRQATPGRQRQQRWAVP